MAKLVQYDKKEDAEWGELVCTPIKNKIPKKCEDFLGHFDKHKEFVKDMGDLVPTNGFKNTMGSAISYLGVPNYVGIRSVDAKKGPKQKYAVWGYEYRGYTVLLYTSKDGFGVGVGHKMPSYMAADVIDEIRELIK